jgi:hypothetical protein
LGHRSKALRILIIPILVKDQQVVVFEDDNAWRDALAKVVAESALPVQYIIPQNKTDDLLLLDVEELIKGNFGQLAALITKYDAPEAVIAMVDLAPEQHQEQSIMLNLRYLSKGHSKSIEKPYVFKEGGSLSFLLQEVAKDFLLSKHDAASLNKSDHLKVAQPLAFVIELGNFADWLYIKQQLVALFGNNNLIIEELSTEHADVLVVNNELIGDIEQLLKRAGIAVQKNNDMLILHRR